jgi:hypothetical protein
MRSRRKKSTYWTRSIARLLGPLVGSFSADNSNLASRFMSSISALNTNSITMATKFNANSITGISVLIVSVMMALSLATVGFVRAQNPFGGDDDPEMMTSESQLKFNCNPIVSPEENNFWDRGFAVQAVKFADEIDKLRITGKVSEWFYTHVSFIHADLETVLGEGEGYQNHTNPMCKAAKITALIMKALLELLEDSAGKVVINSVNGDHTSHEFQAAFAQNFREQLASGTKLNPLDPQLLNSEEFVLNSGIDPAMMPLDHTGMIDGSRIAIDNADGTLVVAPPLDEDSEQSSMRALFGKLEIQNRGFRLPGFEPDGNSNREHRIFREPDGPVAQLMELWTSSLLYWGMNSKTKQPQPEGLMNLILGSGLPMFRLLQQLSSMYPENSSTRLGHCESRPGGPDWTGFKMVVKQVVEVVEIPKLEQGLTLTEAHREENKSTKRRFRNETRSSFVVFKFILSLGHM